MRRATKKTNVVSPMEQISNFIKNLSPILFLKIAGLVVLAIFVLSIGTSLLKSVGGLNPLSYIDVEVPGFEGVSMSSESYPMMYDGSYSGNTQKGGGMTVGSSAILSTRNIASSDSSIMPIPMPSGSTGSTAEDFEVTDYNASIETANIEGVCADLAGLKGLPYVIFENANESDQNCSYSFKVEHAHVDEILAKIEAMDPRSLAENTYTIKKQLDDFTSETEILEKKRSSIEETLETALDAYDEITKLATKTQDAESLARVINSKVQLLERLTQERININQQLDYLARAKDDQLDRLIYTYFYVNAYEKKYIDGEELADSWFMAFKGFVGDVNRALQNATVSLLAFIIQIVIFLLYLFIILIVVKYSWKFGKQIWQK